MTQPVERSDTLYQLLREDRAEEFNRLRAQGAACDLRGANLRGLDLRKLDAAGLDLRDCYLRQADLRGVDLSCARLEGASIKGAKISGAYFPRELPAAEIELSLQHGTRMRCRRLPGDPAA
jgi:uncharacterized protein YjbI with pentapeptide repeats